MSDPSSISGAAAYKEPQQAFDGEWLDARLQDLDGQRDETSYGALIDCYIVLEGACRDEGFPNRASRRLVSERAPRFVPHIARDLNHVPSGSEPTVVATSVPRMDGHQRPALNLAQAALRFTGFLLLMSNGDACRALDAKQQAAVLDALLSSLAGHADRDKVTIQLTIWCLKVQVFEQAVVAPRAHELLALLDAVLKHDFKSRSIENETLRCYIHLMDQVPEAMEGSATVWGLRVVELVVSEAVQLRETAVKALMKGRSFLLKAFQPQDQSKRLVALLNANGHAYSRRMREIAAAGDTVPGGQSEAVSYVTMLRALGFILELLGPAAKLTHPPPSGNRDLGNQLIKLLELPLSGTASVPTVVLALEVWGTFADVVMRGEIRKEDVWSTLLLPVAPSGKLRSRRPLPAACLDAHAKCLWRIVSGIDWNRKSGPLPRVDDVVMPFIDLCFPAATGHMAVAELNVFATTALAYVVTADETADVDRTPTRPMHQPISTALLAQSPDVVDGICKVIHAGLERSGGKAGTRAAWVDCVHSLSRRIAAVAGKGPAVPAGSPAAVLLKAVMRLLRNLAAADDAEVSAVVVTILSDLIERIPEHLLFAAQCYVGVDDRPEKTIAPLQLCFEIAFDCIGRVEDDAETQSRFIDVLGRLAQCATASPKPLFFLSIPLMQFRRLSGFNERRDGLGLIVWARIAEALRATPDAHEGGEDSPKFTTLVDALVAPLQIAAVNHTLIGGPQFTVQWAALLDSMCCRASLLAAGKANLHIDVLAEAMAQLNVDAGSLEPTDFDVFCECVGHVLRSIKVVGSRSEVAFANPKRSFLRAPLALAHSVMRGAQARLAAHSWDLGRAPTYTAVIQELTALITKSTSPKVAKEVTSMIVPRTIEFLQHGFGAHSGRRRRVATPLESAFVELWKATSLKVADVHGSAIDSTAVLTLTPIFVATLIHPSAAVIDASIQLWNKTIGDQPWVDLPSELASVATKVQIDHPNFRLSWQRAATQEVTKQLNAQAAAGAAVVESPVKKAARHQGKSTPKKRTFLGTAGKFLVPQHNDKKDSSQRGAASPKRKARHVDEEASADFVDIPHSPARKRLMTQHQKETRVQQRARQSERPATYTAFDEAHSAPAEFDESPMGTPSPPTKGASRAPSESPVEGSTTLRGKDDVLASPPSILKQEGKRRAVVAQSGRTKKRRVSFDLDHNTVHNKDTGGGAMSPKTDGPSGRRSMPRQILGSPPPAGLSPGRSPGMRSSRTRGEQIVGGMIFGGSAVPVSPIRKLGDMDGQQTRDFPVDVSPASNLTLKSGVQRCLEPAMAPAGIGVGERSCICVALSDCSRPVQDVLPFFHVTTTARRTIGILLRGKKLETVGDFCSLTDAEFAKLPVKMTERTIADLQAYAQKVSHASKSDRSTSPLAQFVGRARTSTRQDSQTSPAAVTATPLRLTASGPRPGRPTRRTPARDTVKIAEIRPSSPPPPSTSPVVQAVLAACTNGLAATKELQKLPPEEQEVMRQRLGELLRSVGGSP
mmetsp:Transcript_17445/g.51643  ORF Transcript_17445/g.51643 Transcript_17445/m.51643 type:complete len:1515 (-) Transcript_17445:2528-7072(-)